MQVVIYFLLFSLLFLALLIFLLILLIRSLNKRRKRIPAAQPAHEETLPISRDQIQVCRSLSVVLKEQRIRCKMTQEFVAEHLGVSRQAVSKWENGTSDPSTSNLLSLAKLYGISPEELLKEVQ